MIKNYALYYGYNKEEELSNFDLVIIESAAHTLEDLKKIRSGRSKIVAYMSFIEIIPGAMMLSKLSNDDFLKNELNERLMNREFGNYMVDIRSVAWREYILGKVKELLEEMCYDGIFIDTVADIEHNDLLWRYDFDLHKSYEALLKEIREAHPEIILIQNNGVNSLLDYSWKYIDFLCWENPPVGITECKSWFDLTVQKLKRFKKIAFRKDFQILLLEENCGDNKKTEIFAKKKKWLYYKANKDYI